MTIANNFALASNESNGIKVEHELEEQELDQEMSGGLAGVIESRIGRLVGNFVEPDLKGWVFGADTDFQLPEVVGTTQPDVAYVSIELLPFPNRNTVMVVPDLAVEVYSKSDSLYTAEDKVKDYLRAGVKLVWLVRPINRLVEAYQPDISKPILYGINDELNGEEVLPGFTLKISEIFRGLPPEALEPEPKRRGTSKFEIQK